MTTKTEERVNGAPPDVPQTTPSIVQVISAVMAEVQAVAKDSRNIEQNYSFRGIDAVVNAVGPVFRRHGVVPVPMLEKASYRDVQTSRGKPSRESTVQVRYRFHGPAGDYLDAVVPGESMDIGDKGTAKAMSVAYRIALLQMLTIPTHDPDPDAQAYERDNDRPAYPHREHHVAKGQEAIAAAQDAATLTNLTTIVERLHEEGTITPDDTATLKAKIRAREVELNGNRAPEPAGAVA